MDKKVDLSSNSTANKIKLNIGKNKSILLTINNNHKPYDVFKPQVNKIGRKPSKLKFKKRTVQDDDQTLTVSQPKGDEQFVVEETEPDEEDDDEAEENEMDDEEQYEDDESPNIDKEDIDKLKDKIDKNKHKQPNNSPGQGGNNPQASPTNTGQAPTTTSVNPTATSSTAGGGAVGGGAVGGGAAGGGAAASGAAGGGTAAGGGIAAAGPYILVAVIIILVIVIIIAIIIVLISGGKYNSSSGHYAYGTTCTKVNVINTDCDASTQNCTNKYNGSVQAEDYIAGVVAAESKGNTNIEYLKVLAVAARTKFIDNVGDNCTVEGNSNFQNYMDINESSNSTQVQQAVSETKNFIAISNDKVVDVEYGYGNIVNEDSTNYYISYGKNTLGTEQTQSIPKSWADSQTLFKTYLDNWESSSESDTGLSLIGALYLITNESYNHKRVIEYYYGSDVEVSENTMILSGINGFMNPTRKIYCTSPFGWRIHPVKKVEKFHGGLDIGIAGGEPIYAAKDGVVTKAVTNVTSINDCTYSYGNYIIIDHGDGSKTLYSHMRYGSVPSNIYEGAEVTQGEQVGEVGSTGCSTGNHLHYEVRINDERVDPADYLDLTNAKGTCRK